jgi:hypothetical protein
MIKEDPEKEVRWLDIWGRNQLTFAEEDGDEARATLDYSGWRNLWTWINKLFLWTPRLVNTTQAMEKFCAQNRRIRPSACLLDFLSSLQGW